MLFVRVIFYHDGKRNVCNEDGIRNEERTEKGSLVGGRLRAVNGVFAAFGAPDRTLADG
jgi:hypothetical protein